MLVPVSLLPTVTALWREVLQTDAFTDDTHFFLAGGDSLQLTRVMLKLQQACGIQLQLRDAVEFSTPGKMAAWCERLLALAPPCDESRPSGLQREYRHYSACPMQQGLWLAEQQAGGVALYNTAALLHMHGRLDIHVLEHALSVLLHQHPVLRTRLEFDVAKRALQGRIASFQPVFLQAEPIAGIDLLATAKARSSLPFDLGERMYRFHLFKLANDQHALLLCCHHAVTDGWSAGVMLQSLAEAYNKLRIDSSWQAQHIDTAFFDYCESRDLRDRGMAQELAWWRQRLGAGSRYRSNPRPATTARWPFAMKSWQTPLGADLLVATGQCCARLQVTPFSCVLGALKLALAARTHDSEQAIGFPVAGRTSPEQENSVGCYVNTSLTRDFIDDRRLSPELLRRIHANVQEALLHPMPLQQLIGQLRPALLPSGNAWFDVLLAFQNLPQREVNFHGLRTSIEAVPASHGQYPLKLELLPVAAAPGAAPHWQLCVEYADVLFEEPEVMAFTSAIRQHLADLATSA